jgi:hypothetical protein
MMRSQFGTVFVQDDHNDPPYTSASDGGPQRRWEAHSSTTPEQLYQWLSANDPSTPAAVYGAARVPTYDNHNSER